MAENTFAKLNRLAKWRSVFAGWQLGTRSESDPECRAVRDHRELSMMLRVEQTAVAGLLIEKGVFTAEEFNEALGREADALSREYEKKFPGFKATEYGMDIDPIVAAETTKGWPA